MCTDPAGMMDISSAGIDMLILLENCPLVNGMYGLHTPGDYTKTYGHGEVVEYGNKRKPTITAAD